MPRYIVENNETGIRTTHRSWTAALEAAQKLPKGQAFILEKDETGTREYDQNGNPKGSGGDFPRLAKLKPGEPL